MNPTTGFLQTRIPIPDTGFIPRDPNTLIPEEMFDFVVVVQDTATSHLTATVKVSALKVSLTLFKSPEIKLCKQCNNPFDVANNKKGQCTHSGQWHGSFSDCNYVKCGFGLGPTQIGLQHWGCCYGTDKNVSTCSKSGKHQDG